MAITQISIFLENKLGRLSEVLSILHANNINIRALSLADTADYGMLRLIVDDTQRCLDTLAKGGIAVKSTPVAAVEVDDKPGGLLGVLKILAEKGINLEYMYAFVEKSGDKAVVVLRFENMEAAEDIIRAKGLQLLGKEDLASL